MTGMRHRVLTTRLASRLGAVALGLLGAIASATAEPRVALIIGNSNYGGDIGNLANPANDAKLMAKTLRGIGFDVVEVEDADQNAMKRAIVDFGNKLGDAGSEATGLFYYAGHGLQVRGENFLIPVKAHIERESDVDIEAVSADLVLKQMDFAGSAVNIVILDACRNDPQLTRGFRSDVRGLAEITRKPRGSFIAYSTAPGEVAADGSGANSPYAKALAETIATPGEGIEEIFRDVRGKVLAATDGKQTPWDSSSLTAPFFFTAAPAAASAGATSTALSGNPQAAELLFWESVKDSKSPDDFRAYLDKYPLGEYAGLANNRLKSLGAVAAAATAQPDATIRNMGPGKDGDIAEQYEQTFWDSVKDSGRVDDISAYLSKYPHGAFAEAAREKLRVLGKAPAPAVASSPPPPLPPFQALDQQVYARDRARLRATPDKNAEVVGRVDAKAVLKATGRTADGAWWRIVLADGRTAYVASSVVSDQPLVEAPSKPASAAPAAPAPAMASSSSAAPPSGKDEDICPSDSSAALADRVAACQRLIAAASDTATKSTALVNLGNNLYGSHQPDEALKNYQAALAIDPKISAAYYNIGLIRSDQGRYAEARSAFDKAAELDADNGDAVYQRGVMRGNLGDFDGAVTDVERAISMKAGGGDAYSELGFLKLAQGDIDAAVKAEDAFVAADPAAWSVAAFAVYYLAGDMEKVADQTDRGIKESPDYAYSWIWKALARRSKGDLAGADAALAAGLKAIKPTDWPAPLLQFMTGKITESRLQELAAAGDTKTQAERLCETSFYRGELAYLAGDKAAARAALQVAAGSRIYYYVEYAAARGRLANMAE
jgi:carboxyl-terminal processing protease